MNRHKTTVSLSDKEFRWARSKMTANDWHRAGDSKGISRYVQELIRKDMDEAHRLKKDPADTSAAVTAKQFLPYESTKLTQEVKEGTTNHVRGEQNSLRNINRRGANHRAGKGNKPTAHNGR